MGFKALSQIKRGLKVEMRSLILHFAHSKLMLRLEMLAWKLAYCRRKMLIHERQEAKEQLCYHSGHM
eukprot:Gb_33977 [translate_table: standard]